MTPWYDSKAICVFGLILMAVVFLFALIGISVAHESLEYRRHISIPACLGALSLSEMIVFTLRLARKSTTKENS
jgi:hypothetical protein